MKSISGLVLIILHFRGPITKESKTVISFLYIRNVFFYKRFFCILFRLDQSAHLYDIVFNEIILWWKDLKVFKKVSLAYFIILIKIVYLKSSFEFFLSSAVNEFIYFVDVVDEMHCAWEAYDSNDGCWLFFIIAFV